MDFHYDVALSFAGEDRAVVEPIASALQAMGLRIFYDKYEEAYLWGKDLYQHLDEVYRTRARFCVIFASAAYARKAWTKHELQSAQARALDAHHEYILPARLDDTDIPGIRPTVAYIAINNRSAVEVAELIAKKVTQPDHASVDSLLDAGLLPSTSGMRDLIVSGEYRALRSEIDALRKAIASRELTSEARHILVDRLARLPKERIGVYASQTDEEAQDFCAVIADAFRDSGWDVDLGVNLYAASIIGVHVVAFTGVGYPLGEIPDVARDLSAALRDAGIAASVEDLREMPHRSRLFIAIGKKPRGA